MRNQFRFLASAAVGARNHARHICALLFTTAALSTTLQGATVRTWTGASTSGNWTSAANWAGNQAPVAGDILNFVDSGLRKSSNTNNYAAGTAFSTINLFGTGYRLRGNSVTISNYVGSGVPTGTNTVDLDLAATGPGVGLTLRSAAASDRLILNGDINLNARTLTTEGPGDLVIGGAISGTSGIRKDNTGELSLAGLGANTFTGTTIVNAGILRLSRYNVFPGPTFAGVTAIPGDLVIGTGTGGLIADIVVLERDNQIANTSDVTVNGSGSLELSGENDTIGSLTLLAGTVTTGTGMLTLGGNVRVNALTEGSSISGRLNLGSGTHRMFDVLAGARLTVSAEISGAAGISLVKSNRGELYLSASNIFSGDTEIVGGTLIIAHSAALGTTSGRTLLRLGDLIVHDVGTFAEILDVQGPAATLTMDSFSASWNGPVILNDDLTIDAPPNRVLNITGQISGPGGFTKIGDGGLQFKTTYTNTYAGTGWVRRGFLTLDGVFSQVVVSGPLIIGDHLNPAGSEEVRYIKHQQISDTVPITINKSGILDLGGFDDTVGPLIFYGGAVETTGGTLTLNGDVTVHPTNATASISGELALGSTTRTFNVMHGDVSLDLAVSAVITGGAGVDLIKTGNGTARFTGANTYSGTTRVNAGEVQASHNSALGSVTGNTVVLNGGQVTVAGSVTIAENISVSGGAFVQGALQNIENTNVWTGNITLESNSVIGVYGTFGELKCAGSISGIGALTKVGPRTLILTGPNPNSFAGAFTVNQGTVLLSKTNGVIAVPGALIVGDGNGGALTDVVRTARSGQIAGISAVTVSSSGLLDLSGGASALGSLAGSGKVDLGQTYLNLGSNNLSRIFSGILTNFPAANGMSKFGSGVQVFTGNSPFHNLLSIEGGGVIIHGLQTNTNVRVKTNTFFGGEGTVNLIEVQSGGTLGPGDGIGRLTARGLVGLAAGTFDVELDGLSPGTAYDQLRTMSSIQLGANLNVTLSFTPALDDSFTLIDNLGASPVQGAFAGLPQNGQFAADGVTFFIDYQGGDGNDVVITRVPGVTFSSIMSLGPTQMRLRAQGLPGAQYIVEATPHLNAPIPWAPISTNTANGIGLVEFIDLDVPLFPQRFYRIAAP